MSIKNCSVLTLILFRVATVILGWLLLSGCVSSLKLMPTPNIYRSAEGFPEKQVPETLRSSMIDLLYVTDRVPKNNAKNQLSYGSRRSASVAFGSTIVEIGEQLSWQELVQLSQSDKRKTQPSLKVTSTHELGRFPATPHPFSVKDGKPVVDPEVVTAVQQSNQIFHSELKRRLAISKQKEVLIFVHGFNNSFDWAAASEAELWHFSGRRGVPILYSWPAASGGLFGYFIDRESGEFTIYHLKEFIRLLASFPEIERINIIAHSRGTDVTTTALRELVIESRAMGKNPLESLKIENLILAAPDLDLDIVRQRLMAEKFGPAFKQITIYTNSTDSALNLSETLMSGTRFGRMDASDLKKADETIFSQVTNVNIIDVGAVQSFFGHSYFLNHPATSSDILLILKDGSFPGDASRPLKKRFLNFWDMPKDYLESE